jgi:hypothetical protein
MTRGQDSLTIDELTEDHALGSVDPVDISLLILVVAAPEEVAAHEAVLDTIAKDAKATPVWRAAAHVAAATLV